MSDEEEAGQGEWRGFVRGGGRQWGPPSSVGSDLLRWADVLKPRPELKLELLA